MKNTIKLFILLFGLTLCSCTTEQPKKVEDPTVIKSNLLKTIDEFNKAFKDSDVAKLESMITDNYRHTNGIKKAFSKKTWLKYLQRRQKKIEAGELEIHFYEMNQTKIELYDDVAIVTAKISVESTNKEELQENEYRVTNIWVNEDGNWKRAGFHDGKIK
ncbi:nuclear transport factor 2 family protein [Aquimarina sp. 2201CG5-10]|uniref:nuclear transport factor 2 family protein n=1 Tax=Aquimarina callyspongiae TaxID=3098150 RepID=UPI002AC90D50|nr:nuclear transport factor 2 family protein [Aquimarina sp. 2201CG5-10]